MHACRTQQALKGHEAACLENQIEVRQLKKHGIHQLIVMGLIAHTCVEATVRFAAELGYEVTMVKDATADYSDEEMHAALDVNILNYASAIVITNEVVEALSFHVRLTHSTSKA